MDEIKEKKIKKKKVEKKILKNKNNEGRSTYRLTIPKEWLEDMMNDDNDDNSLSIGEDDSVVLEYIESLKTISVKRKEKKDKEEPEEK